MNPRIPFAVFSECEWGDVHRSGLGPCHDSCHGRRYRYQLWWPTGIDNEKIALGIFANPSTATAQTLDPTLTRWRNYCRDWGYGWSVTANVRAWRETHPKLVPEDPRAIGPDNDEHLKELVRRAAIVVCGWGKLGRTRGPKVLELIRGEGKVPHALKLNGDKTPAHPLYLHSQLTPIAMGVP